jgi:predicted DNA-binding transcriptional regulator YafY
MKYSETKEKLEYLLELIKKECTGNAADLCRRAGISERTFYRYLYCMRDMGYPISYCKWRQTYYLVTAKENK